MNKNFKSKNGRIHKKKKRWPVWCIISNKYSLFKPNYSVDGNTKTIFFFTFEDGYSSGVNMFFETSSTFVVAYTSSVLVSLFVLD